MVLRMDADLGGALVVASYTVGLDQTGERLKEAITVCLPQLLIGIQ